MLQDLKAHSLIIFCAVRVDKMVKEKVHNSSLHNLDGNCQLWSLQSSESPFKV